MTLSEVVSRCIGDCLSVQLTPERSLGPTNKVDFFGVSPEHGDIRVELERRREDPVNNVAKAWRQAYYNPDEPPFILVHVFSGHYSATRQARFAKSRNARFAGERMTEWAKTKGRGIRYVALSFDYEPTGAADHAIPEIDRIRICDQIRSQLQVALSP